MEPSAKRPRLEELGVLDDSFDNDVSFVDRTAPADCDSFDEDESIVEGPPLILTQAYAATQQQHVLNERQVNVVQTFNSKTQVVLPSVPHQSSSAQTQRPPSIIRTSSTSLTQSARNMAQMEFMNPSQQESGLVMMLRRQNENLRRDNENKDKKLGMVAAAREEERRNVEESHKRQTQALLNENGMLKRQVVSMSMSTSTMNSTQMHNSFSTGTQPVDHLNTSIANRSIVVTRPVERRVAMPRPAYPKPRTTRNSMGSSNRSPVNQSPVFKHPTPHSNDSYQHFSTQQMATDNSAFHPPKPPVPVAAAAPRIPKIEPKIEPIEKRDSECQTGNVDEEMMKRDGIMVLETDPRDDFVLKLLSAALQADDFSISRVEPMLRGADYIPLKRNDDSPPKPSVKIIKDGSSSPPQ